MTVLQIYTRFRAYQLGTAGSSFSYFAAGDFTLIEARLTEKSKPCVDHELRKCGKRNIDCLHITSWDQDHCSHGDLVKILELYKPAKIEYPGYPPSTDNGKECRKTILAYSQRAISEGQKVECVSITPEYISNLKDATEFGYTDIVYGPKILADNSNDNSTVKVFREGCFNVASLGDVEDANIGARLRNSKIFKNETDVLILAHHGANCPTNSKNFFERVEPQLVICTSDYDNQHDHPREEVRQTLHELNIPIYTTKTGDVIIESLPPHEEFFRVFNLKSNSEETSSVKDFKIKKYHFLNMNYDTIKDLYKSKPPYKK